MCPSSRCCRARNWREWRRFMENERHSQFAQNLKHSIWLLKHELKKNVAGRLVGIDKLRFWKRVFERLYQCGASVNRAKKFKGDWWENKNKSYYVASSSGLYASLIITAEFLKAAPVVRLQFLKKRYWIIIARNWQQCNRTLKRQVN